MIKSTSINYNTTPPKNLFDNASDIELAMISSTMSPITSNLALQQIAGQCPKEAISASFLIHVEPSYTTKFLQLKRHYEITNHRNKEMSYVGTLFCQ